MDNGQQQIQNLQINSHEEQSEGASTQCCPIEIQNEIRSLFFGSEEFRFDIDSDNDSDDLAIELELALQNTPLPRLKKQHAVILN